MKFLYLDETGTDGKSKNVIVAGICVDAYKLNTTTKEFDKLYQDMYKEYNKHKFMGQDIQEIKTHRLIDGKRKWKKIPLDRRKKFLTDICEEAANRGTIFANAISEENFKSQKTCFNFPDHDAWDAAIMFLVGTVQRLGQKTKHNKGSTVLIVDENSRKVDSLRKMIHDDSPWYNPLYYTEKPTSRRPMWKQPRGHNGLSQIINSGFFTKSEYSSLIQVADAIAKIYSMHLELHAGRKEDWTRQADFFEKCVKTLDKKRENLPIRSNLNHASECVKFYNAVKPSVWKL